jgi:hypothetical protein
VINGLRVTDYSVHPPVEGASYPVFVPKIDADGNEVVGIRLPEVSVPLATYAGWNSTIPFAGTRSERLAARDPRPSIEERYESHEKYVQAVERAARGLAKKRLLLEEDVSLYVEMARQRDLGL